MPAMADGQRRQPGFALTFWACSCIESRKQPYKGDFQRPTGISVRHRSSVRLSVADAAILPMVRGYSAIQLYFAYPGARTVTWRLVRRLASALGQSFCSFPLFAYLKIS